jgi:hypothetical protein
LSTDTIAQPEKARPQVAWYGNRPPSIDPPEAAVASLTQQPPVRLVMPPHVAR